jgi:hypothetical protein
MVGKMILFKLASFPSDLDNKLIVSFQYVVSPFSLNTQLDLMKTVSN